MPKKKDGNESGEKKMVIRWVLYLLGMITLAMGIVLSANSELGVSPIISVAYTVSHIWGWNLGNAGLA